jgi:hypothetical protein
MISSEREEVKFGQTVKANRNGEGVEKWMSTIES